VGFLLNDNTQKPNQYLVMCDMKNDSWKLVLLCILDDAGVINLYWGGRASNAEHNFSIDHDILFEYCKLTDSVSHVTIINPRQFVARIMLSVEGSVNKMKPCRLHELRQHITSQVYGMSHPIYDVQVLLYSTKDDVMYTSHLNSNEPFIKIPQIF